GAAVMVRDGHVRSGTGIGANGRYFSEGVRCTSLSLAAGHRRDGASPMPQGIGGSGASPTPQSIGGSGASPTPQSIGGSGASPTAGRARSLFGFEFSWGLRS